MFKWLLIKVLRKYCKDCQEELDLACFSYDCSWLSDKQQQEVLDVKANMPNTIRNINNILKSLKS